MNRRRIIYFVLAQVTVAAGLASRRFREYLPWIIAEYAGDTLWALMVFLLVSLFSAGRSIALRLCISAVLALAVELSQLVHTPWLQSLRETALGGLILGFGFLWTDLVCYSIGIGTGASAEYLITRGLRINLNREQVEAT